jgi:hypothetical protein
MNSLGHADHTIAAILGMDPDIIVGSLKSLISTAKPNFLIVDGHHMAEKTAAIEAINTMMLRSIDSCLYLFPNWIAKAASFTRLRTKGAFLVSADYDGSKVTNLKIVSDKGTLCKIKNPWAGTSMIVMETLDGLTAPVECTIENDIYSFPTKAGASYTFDIQTSVPNVIHEKSTFTVFPNPVSNTVRVVLNNKCGDNSSFVNVYAVNGTKCLSQKLERGISDILMDVSDLGNGFYFVNYKESSEKLIIRK